MNDVSDVAVLHVNKPIISDVPFFIAAIIERDLQARIRLDLAPRHVSGAS